MQNTFVDLLKNKGVQVVDYDIKGQNGRSAPKRDATIGITYHHTATSDRDITSHDNYHKNERGWIMVGYHGQIREDGSFELGRPINTRGAHAGNEANDTTIGVAFSGNMNEYSPSDAQYKTSTIVHEVLEELYDKELKIYGHKHWASTDCPGREVDLSVIESGLNKGADNEKVKILINDKESNIPSKLEDGRTFVKLDDKWIGIRALIDLMPNASIDWIGEQNVVKIEIG